MSQWVQHKSGQGEKWEVIEIPGSSEIEFHVRPKTLCEVRYHSLPKTEYIPCDPPEEWEDVTGECEPAIHLHEFHVVFDDRLQQSVRGDNYRLRKISGPHHGPCFIVERRKS